MLFIKMNEIIDEVNEDVAERSELIECIALCLIARKNLFILGDTGQAKSYAINEFRKRITGAKQFERLMSKQTDEEQIFGRLDLSSLIPGNLPEDELMKEDTYKSAVLKVEGLYEKYKTENTSSALNAAEDACRNLVTLRRILCSMCSNKPKMVTEGKIPDSHIVFLDELFKANDGILNSLLTALNEKVYTNEGETVNIPVISFFSASNEIPDFNDSTQAILKPLYDRFELKVRTNYVEEKENRLKVLKGKQNNAKNTPKAYITLDELYEMQKKAESIVVPDEINELMDSILCELRRADIHVSDRKFFGFTPIVRAKAYLNGNNEVTAKDLLVLKNYFWNNPSEIPTVGKILSDLCENPIGTEIDRLISMAGECKTVMEERLADIEAKQDAGSDKIKAYVVFSKELFRIYIDLDNLKSDELSDDVMFSIIGAQETMEKMLAEAAQKAKAPCVGLEAQKQLAV